MRFFYGFLSLIFIAFMSSAAVACELHEQEAAAEAAISEPADVDADLTVAESTPPEKKQESKKATSKKTKSNSRKKAE